jgi:transposase, IS5 family
MAIKRTGQLGFADAVLSGGVSPLDRISELVQWERFDRLLGSLRKSGAGRPAWPPLVLFKALVVGSLYGLSEREIEAAVADRLSFRRFVGLSLAEPVPDHSVLNRFRNELVELRLLEALFAELDEQLETAGVMLKHGTMMDATVIPSVSRPGRTSSDPQAGFAKRTGKPGSVFGYKAHVGVDEGSGLIRSVLSTPANIGDTTPADALIRGDERQVWGDERQVWGDKAYHSHARVAHLKASGIKPRLMVRGNKHHELPDRIVSYNKLISRRRAAVETTFATLKQRMKLTAIRYRGLAKAAAQITLAAIAFNLRRWAALVA